MRLCWPILRDAAGAFPAGVSNPGESAEQAARRESHEEIGAVLGPLHLLGHYLLTPASMPQESSPGAAQGVENVAQTVLIPHAHHAVPDARLAAAYAADVTALVPLPSGTESRGVRRVPYEELHEELRACYYAWDALLEAMFAYAWAHHDAAL